MQRIPLVNLDFSWIHIVLSCTSGMSPRYWTPPGDLNSKFLLYSKLQSWEVLILLILNTKGDIIYNIVYLLICFKFLVMHPPRLDSVENLMKLSQMVTQGVWDSKSAFLMLPHISQDQLRHFSTKKVRCNTCKIVLVISFS